MAFSRKTIISKSSAAGPYVVSCTVSHCAQPCLRGVRGDPCPWDLAMLPGPRPWSQRPGKGCRRDAAAQRGVSALCRR